MDDKSSIDYKLIEEYEKMLGLEVVQQMINVYEDSFKVYFDEIKKAFNQDCCQTWHEHCHRLKGATSSMGFLTFTAYLTEIDHKHVSERVGHPYIEMINKLNDESLEYLKNWVSTR